MFECDLAHRRSVAVLCMLYKIKCNPMHPLYGAFPVPYVPVRVTRGAVIRYTSVHLCASSPQYRRTLWNHRGDLVFDGAGLAGYRSRVNL